MMSPLETLVFLKFMFLNSDKRFQAQTKASNQITLAKKKNFCLGAEDVLTVFT